MGNWSEITIENGRLRVTGNGRTADLQADSLRDLELDTTREFLTRYGPYGADVDGGVDPKFWSNATMSPDMPSVGIAMSQMYEDATGRTVDGVLVIDPAGIAGLLDITGPVQLDDIDQRIDSGNAVEFLTLGQYEFAENEREDLLTEVTDRTVENVLSTTLPPPQQMAPALAPAVLNGHISAWVADPDGQELLELVGMDGALPFPAASGSDAIAVVSHNASGNKIESFLERTIDYRPVIDQTTGVATATMTVELTNSAPTTGYPDSVIGNIVDAPTGTNRMTLEIFTRIAATEIRVDGEVVPLFLQTELGYFVVNRQLDVPAGETVLVDIDLAGQLSPGPYQLVYRPQPLPTPDTLVVESTTPGGSEILSFDGVLERRSVITPSGVSAWR